MSAPPARSPTGRPRRRERRRLHPLVVAVIIIVVTSAVTTLAFNEGLPFVHKFTVYALVDNSVNVRSSDPVRIAGIDVGSVESVSSAGQATRIGFSLQPVGQPIHTDATVTIRDRLFLEGSYYLDLNPGTPDAPIMRDGGTIPMAQTASPVQFYKVLSIFDAATRSNLTGQLATLDQSFDQPVNGSLASSGAGALKAAVPQLAPVARDGAIVTRALRGTAPGDVGRLLASAAAVSTTLAAHAAALGDLVTRLDQTASALAASDGALGDSVRGLDLTLQAAPPALQAVDRALPPVDQLSVALDPSLRQAPPIVSRITATVDKLGAIVAPVQRTRLLSTLRATFAQFPTVLTELARAFPITKTVTDCLRTHIVPLFERQVPDGPLSTGRPVWQDFAHFLPNLAGASGNFDANGPYTRVLASGGTNTLAGGPSFSLPGLGPVVGSGPPGGSTVTGARPKWVGDLTPADFRPDVACATQPLPNLAATTAASDLTPRRAQGIGPMTAARLRAALARVLGRGAPTAGARTIPPRKARAR